MKTTATRDEVIQAIAAVNKKYGYALSLERDEQKGKWFFFTLKTPSGVPGSRVGFTGRKLAKASWHAHGYLFEAILNINKKALIITGSAKVSTEGGNWIDTNIGSQARPMMFSETSIL